MSGGLVEVLAAHCGVGRYAPTFRGWDDVRWRCSCGANVDEDPSGVAITNRHRAHVAAAVTTWLTERLASEEVAQRGAAVYWNHRQGVPLDAWTPPIEVESMHAALIAVTAALRGES